MEIDPLDIVESAKTQVKDTRLSWLNPAVAITVALLATFLGVCKVKDDNIVQAMQQAQADKLDHWAFYQTRNIREEVAQVALDQIKLAELAAPADQQAKYREAAANYERLVADQSGKKE